MMRLQECHIKDCIHPISKQNVLIPQECGHFICYKHAEQLSSTVDSNKIQKIYICQVEECDQQSCLNLNFVEQIFDINTDFVSEQDFQPQNNSVNITDCSRHQGNPIMFYCKLEKQALCAFCVEDHFDHATGNLQTLKEDQILNQFKDLIKDLKPIKDQADRIFVQLNNVINRKSKVDQNNFNKIQEDASNFISMFKENLDLQNEKLQSYIEMNKNQEILIQELKEQNQQYIIENNDLKTSKEKILIQQQESEFEKEKALKFINLQSKENKILQTQNMILNQDIDKLNQTIQDLKLKQDKLLKKVSLNIQSPLKNQYSLQRNQKLIKKSSFCSDEGIDFDSLIAKKPELKLALLNMVPNANGLDLLYRGTRDGFKSKNFMTMCGDKGETLSIVQTKEFKNVLGGYTNIPWSKQSPRYGQWMKGDHKSFLFKVYPNNEIVKLHHLQSEQYETFHYNDMLPCFGNDLYLYEDCNTNCNSQSDVGFNYEAPEGIDKYSEQAKEFLAGQYKFQVLEIEVYKVLY